MCISRGGSSRREFHFNKRRCLNQLLARFRIASNFLLHSILYCFIPRIALVSSIYTSYSSIVSVHFTSSRSEEAKAFPSSLSSELSLLTHLQTRLTPAFERKTQNKHTSSDEQCTAHVDGRTRLQVGKHGDDGRHDAEYAIRAGRNGISSTAVFGREDFGRVGIQDCVHDVGHEVVGAVPSM